MDYTNKLHVVYDDNILGLDGKDFQYLFSYEQGGRNPLRLRVRSGFTGARAPLLAGNDR